jgi:hypothetical protein
VNQTKRAVLAARPDFAEKGPDEGVEAWSLSIQRQVMNNTVLEIAYLGRRGIGLFGAYDVNQAEIVKNGFLEAFNIVKLSTSDGIRLNHPIVNGEVSRQSVATGDAWMKGGISRIEVRVTDPNGATTVLPAARDTVKYRGKPILPSEIMTSLLARLPLASAP